MYEPKPYRPWVLDMHFPSGVLMGRLKAGRPQIWGVTEAYLCLLRCDAWGLTANLVGRSTCSVSRQGSGHCGGLYKVHIKQTGRK